MQELKNEEALKLAVDRYKKGEEGAEEEVIELLSQELTTEAGLMLEQINSKPETTKGRYQEYMNWLLQFQGIYRKAMVKALLRAGGDLEGIEGALMVIKGE